MIVPIILFCDSRCVLTLEHTPQSLIQALATIAVRLGVRFGRAKRRRPDAFWRGALDPALRVRYDTIRRVRPSMLFYRIRRAVTPLGGLAGVVALSPCATHSADGNAHSR